MNTKKCSCCHDDKPISDFYARGSRSSSSCKDCIRKRARNRYNKLAQSPAFLTKENERKKKYSQKINKANHYERYPEKRKAKIAAQVLTKAEGYNNHHWSYNEEHWLDTISILFKEHRLLHKHMVYDSEQLMYRRADNNILLDTKESHIAYLAEIKSLPQ